MLLLASAAFAATPTDAPDAPLALVGRVVDGAGVLSPATEAELTHRLAEYESASGIQVVVATIGSLGDSSIEEYGAELGRRWGIGTEGKDNGVLLLVAPNDRRVRIEVGYGLEGDLTDAKSSRIIRNRILPAFQRGDIDAGVRGGVAGILEVLGGEAATRAPGGEVEQVRHYAPAIGFWVLFFFILFVTLGGRRRRRRGIGSALFWASVLGGLPRDRSGGFRGGGFGGGGGGGGFRGGGGSFGGGGASGSW